MSFLNRGVFAVFLSILFAGEIFGKDIFHEETTGKKQHIVGGAKVDINSFPYQVSIRHDNFHTCGGAIISNYHILTAAHCFDGEHVNPSYDNSKVVSGTSWNSRVFTFFSIGVVNDIKNVTMHPGYVLVGNSEDDFETIANDIAVIELSEPLIFNDYQNPVKLPTEKAEPGTFAVITGWGNTVRDSREVAFKLRAARMRTMSKKRCEYLVGDITSEQICASNGFGIGACNGDSGGPLVNDNKIIGIASFVTDECGVGSPDVYTTVHPYIAFINEVIHAKNNLVTNYETQVSCSATSTDYLKKSFFPAWENQDLVDEIVRNNDKTEKYVREYLELNDVYTENIDMPIVPNC